jgi:very-short-patch-repair endonuclease
MMMLARSAHLARHLRQNATSAERTLWRLLRGGAVDNLRFRRQHPIDRYVADFACVTLKLAIEVDGRIHEDEERTLRDLARTEVIERLGWQVLRITNEDVSRDPNAVVAAIRRAAQAIRGG